MHENDQDYEVAEPAAVSGEDSDTQRSRAGRFWRSQADRVTGADDGRGLDDEAALDDETARTGDTLPADETGLGNEVLPDDEVDEGLPDDDVIVVAEVIDTESASAAGDGLNGDGLNAERAGQPTAMPAATGVMASADDAAGNGANARVPAAAGPGGQSFGGQEWREIQATFVDDPHGAVQMAASAADSALDALVTGLRARQSSLGTAGTQDTEQLRAALQEYRKFCQSVSDIGRQLPEPVAARS